MEEGRVYWDIVDIQFPDLVRGCDEGLFERLDASLLADGVPASEVYAILEKALPATKGVRA